MLAPWPQPQYKSWATKIKVNYRLFGSLTGVGMLIDDHSQDPLGLFHWFVMLHVHIFRIYSASMMGRFGRPAVLGGYYHSPLPASCVLLGNDEVRA